MVATQSQYEFVHHVLGELVSREEGEKGRERETERTDRGKTKREKKAKKSKGTVHVRIH